MPAQNYCKSGEKPVLNALTIDVEEWYQTILFDSGRWCNRAITNLPNNIYEILSLLDKYDTKATFFILGSVAEKYPGLIKTIAERGHEIASHGYLHRLVYKMSKQSFIDDVSHSLDILKVITQTEILGYRAPTWSITRNLCWAIDILQSLGLKYDSSIYPVSFNPFKSVKVNKFPHEIKNNFIEFPPSTFQFLGYNFPFAGGTFLRFFSSGFIKSRIIEINSKGYPAMIYFHSWEFDNEVPETNLPKWKRLIQYGNLKSVKEKLKLLLRNFKFSTMKDILRLS